MKKLVIILFTSILLSACQVDIENVLHNSQTIEVFIHQHEKPMQSYKLTTQDPKYSLLKQWAENNKSGWQTSPASYLPKVMVKGENFTINFINDLAIVNYGGKQYVKKVNQEEYKYLLITST